MDIDMLQRTGSSLYVELFERDIFLPLVHRTNTRMPRIPKISIANHETEILLYLLYYLLFCFDEFSVVKNQFMLFLKDRYEENVLRFDNLSKDLAEFGERHGIDIRNLPRQNESEMPRFSVEDLDETTRLMIETIFAKDFDLLGFKRKATGRRDM